MKNNLVRLGALGASATLALMAGGPAWAAPVVSQAEANAITFSLGGNGTDSGTVVATNDGTGEQKEGVTTPPISVLKNQELANFGVLQQDAAAQVQDGDGVSGACAGVAGEGGSVAEVGDSNCIFPGQPVALTIANLDLTGTVAVDPESALAPLNDALDPLMEEVVGPVTAAVSEALAPLGDTGLVGTFSVVEERCVAAPGVANAEATLENAKLTLTLDGESIDLANLPTHPAPNTKVVTGMDEVLNLVVDAVEVDLRTTLQQQLAPLADAGLTDALQKEVIDTVVAQVSDGLQPVEDDILDITLNAQSTPAPDAIRATALDLQLLPAAAEFAESSLLDLRLGNVQCGPNSVLGTEAEAPATQQQLPEVPTVVDSGVAGDDSDGGLGLGAAAVALTGLAGLVGYRRLAAGR